MPLGDLVEYFNQRIIEEQNLDRPPLSLKDGLVEGHFGELRLASRFQAVRQYEPRYLIAGQDAHLQAFRWKDQPTSLARVYHAADSGSIINVDRLCRTIHMLNFLPDAHQEGFLFLHVHPRHILGVRRDHGAYFEEVIFRCGLSPRRVVINVPITPLYDRQLTLLLEGLRNYQARGYGTAIKFDDKANETFLERYCIEFLYRITPDFVRLDSNFFKGLRDVESGKRRKTTLLSVIQSLDAQFLVEGIRNVNDFEFAKSMRADLVTGEYLETLAMSETPKARKAFS